MSGDELEIALLLGDGAQPMQVAADALAGFLATAERDVAIAIDDFHFPPDSPGETVARTLQDLRRRGVRVRIVDHDDRQARMPRPAPAVPPPPAAPEYIDALGLDVGSVVSFDAFTRQENCAVIVRSSTIAEAYLRNFEELRRKGEADGTGGEELPWQRPRAPGRDARVRPLSCPGGGPEGPLPSPAPSVARAGGSRSPRRC